jgi:hypothetical protein
VTDEAVVGGGGSWRKQVRLDGRHRFRRHPRADPVPPYKSIENRIDGAVLALIDIDDRRASKEKKSADDDAGGHARDDDDDIVPARLGQDAGILGALAPADRPDDQTEFCCLLDRE